MLINLIMKQNNIIKIIFFCIFFLFASNWSNAESSDAIAIRVIPNSNHLSAIQWFMEQEFTGAPQTLEVDGYNAVRDGRTVYVNAANAAGANLYTNIYLISYNQGSEQATIDIFGQMLSHWKFNTNLNRVGSCSDDVNKYCQVDFDCEDSGYCKSTGECNSTGENCFSNNDCGGLICLQSNSGALKAEVVRDVKRYEILNDVKSIIDSRDGSPNLLSGTYIPGYSLSVWPSWQETLASELNTVLPIDPINKIGTCSLINNDNYQPNTCWDEENKLFSTTLPDLPGNSNILMYHFNNSDSTYEICLIMESSFFSDSLVCIN